MKVMHSQTQYQCQSVYTLDIHCSVHCAYTVVDPVMFKSLGAQCTVLVYAQCAISVPSVHYQCTSSVHWLHWAWVWVVFYAWVVNRRIRTSNVVFRHKISHCQMQCITFMYKQINMISYIFLQCIGGHLLFLLISFRNEKANKFDCISSWTR